MSELKPTLSLIAIVTLQLACLLNVAFAQDERPGKLHPDAKQARAHSLNMLDEMKNILEEHYYDPKFRGINLDSRIEAAKVRVKSLQYNWQMYRVLVQVLMDFNDSHTRMILPQRTDHFEYGIRMQMIGDSCFITWVKKESDAFKKGIRVGDQVLTMGRFTPTREDLWKMNYVLYRLDPAKEIDLKIRKVDGSEQTVRVTARTMTDKEFRAELEAKRQARKKRKNQEPYRCRQIGADVMACKLYSFVVERNDIDKMMTEALKFPKLILDLRGNSGGYVSIEQYVASHFFNREVKIADFTTRKKTEARLTKPVGDRMYKGEVTVLVDSNSASAAEMTARVLQIEKRAKVYGDYSSGRVMTSISLPFRDVAGGLSYTTFIYVGMSVTIADVIMSDGSRLENTGVQPDLVLQPTASALAKRLDPVLAFAAQKFGAPITPEEAGKLYFMISEEDYEDSIEDDAEAGKK